MDLRVASLARYPSAMQREVERERQLALLSEGARERSSPNPSCGLGNTISMYGLGNSGFWLQDCQPDTRIQVVGLLMTNLISNSEFFVSRHEFSTFAPKFHKST